MIHNYSFWKWPRAIFQVTLVAILIIPNLAYGQISNQESNHTDHHEGCSHEEQPSFLGSIKNARKATGNHAKFSAATMHNVVIFIRFNGENEFPASSRATFEQNLMGPTGTSSLRNYYLWNSYNQLDIQSTIVGGTSNTVFSYQSPRDRGYYEPFDSQTNPQGYESSFNRRIQINREHELLEDAVSALRNNMTPGTNLDGNNDGEIDQLMFIIRGTNSPQWLSILWPHKQRLPGTTDINGFEARNYVVLLEIGANVGLMAHETGHTLGSPDYYKNSSPVTPVGGWELMANQTNPPQSMSAFVKHQKMGFIDDIPEITETGNYTLKPLGTHPEAYKIPSTKENEYFIVEYRRQTPSLFESQIPGSGLLIYRVNAAGDEHGNNGFHTELYLYRPGGLNPTTNGDLSQAAFSLESGRTDFTDNMPFHAFMTDNSLGNLNITNIGSAGQTISFHYDKSYCEVDSDDFLTYNGNSTIPLTSTAQNIRAEDGVSIEAGESITFRSEKTTLSTGFSVKKGGNFRAEFLPCTDYFPIPESTMLIARLDDFDIDIDIDENDQITANRPIAMEGFKIYPNPSNTHVNIEFSDISGISQVEIYDATANLVESLGTEQFSKKTTVNISTYQPGVYFVLVTKENESIIERLIVN